MRILVVLFSFSLLCIGCSSTQRNGDGDILEGTGTVQYIELEGGFYGIVGDDGRQYDPVDLDEAYKEDGLRVHFRARTVEDMASIRMWGTIVNLVSIERI